MFDCVSGFEVFVCGVIVGDEVVVVCIFFVGDLVLCVFVEDFVFDGWCDGYEKVLCWSECDCGNVRDVVIVECDVGGVGCCCDVYGLDVVIGEYVVLWL